MLITARVRLRKMVKGRVANFERFLLFSAAQDMLLFVNTWLMPKTAEIAQASEVPKGEFRIRK